MTDNYPIHNAILNFKTAINQDEAVWMMLGLPSVTPDIIDKYADDIEFSLEANLTFFREALVDTYEDAQNKFQEDTTAENSERALQELKDFDEYIIRQANRYLCDVEDEIAKGAESKFRFKDGLITINSFNEWFSSFNKALTNQTKECLDNETYNKIAKSKKTTPKSENTALITFATLLELFLTGKPKTAGFYRNEKINVTAVARHLEKHANGIEGQGEENIKTLIENAITAKQKVKH
jgi:hypothetical protein